jgi:16S rRNA (cytidine1402-2'-O)-methyltransferase
MPEREALWEELAACPYPVVAFESPKRLHASLTSLASALPGRRAAVCRELTKAFEEVVRGPVEELVRRFAEPPKGEITLVIGPGDPGAEAPVDLLAVSVAELVAAGAPRKVAVDVVARLTGASRNALYRASL